MIAILTPSRSARELIRSIPLAGDALQGRHLWVQSQMLHSASPHTGRSGRAPFAQMCPPAPTRSAAHVEATHLLVEYQQIERHLRN